jgi:23S rRNA (guanosine2251-2'-O)-methyltransferase
VWLYGRHTVVAALANPRRRRRRLVATPEAARDLAARLGTASVAVDTMERADIARLLPGGAVHQGLALLADPLPEVPLAEVCAAHGPVLVLDRADDPRNVGAVVRSAAAFGAAAVVVPRRHAPEATGALAKAASGGLELVPLVRVTNLARALGQIQDAGLWCVGLDAAAPTSLAAAGLGRRTALVLGAEGAGLRRLTRRACDSLASIPTRRASLNLAAAAAIALYELARG